jgi:tRNA A-37 threonylcarbamoyl transferase component Bud32
MFHPNYRISFSQFLSLKHQKLPPQNIQQHHRNQTINNQQPQSQQQPQKEQETKIKETKIKETENADEIRRIQFEMINKLKLLKTPHAILNYLNKLQVIRKFNNVHTSSVDVCLLEGYIVRKKCINDSLGNFMFWNEVKALKKIGHYPHFPFLIAYDPNSLTIYMTYCGPTLTSNNLPKNWKTQYEEISKIMNITNVNSNDILLRNICYLGDEIKIIDFGLHTIFGKTIKESLNELYILLSNLDTNKNLNIPINSDTIYNNYYPGWKEKLERYDFINKKYIEFIENMKNKKKK